MDNPQNPQQQELLKVQHSNWLRTSETLTFIKNLEANKAALQKKAMFTAETTADTSIQVRNLLVQAFALEAVLEFMKKPECIVSNSKVIVK